MSEHEKYFYCLSLHHLAVCEREAEIREREGGIEGEVGDCRCEM